MLRSICAVDSKLKLLFVQKNCITRPMHNRFWKHLLKFKNTVDFNCNFKHLSIKKYIYNECSWIYKFIDLKIHKFGERVVTDKSINLKSCVSRS